MNSDKVIKFCIPTQIGKEIDYVIDACNTNKLCGDGFYTKRCEGWFEQKFGSPKALMTPSCTAALEMAAILLDIKPGDEVIIPSYTFVSTANAFILRGASVKFVDIDRETMNIDVECIKNAATPKTKAIVVVHYAGVPCDMDKIMEFARSHGIFVVEDAAQAIMSTYKGQPVGSHGVMSAFSFHETKNITSGGEGGMLVINDKNFVSRAEIIREKGTNRSLFLNGSVDKYTWVDQGSSFLPSELQAAYLLKQLESADMITEKRMFIWQWYQAELLKRNLNKFVRFSMSDSTEHNAHIFFIKTNSLVERRDLIEYMKSKGIQSTFHYVPLHSSPYGKEVTEFIGDDINTTTESSLLVRLPIWYSMDLKQQKKVVDVLEEFYKIKRAN